MAVATTGIVLALRPAIGDFVRTRGASSVDPELLDDGPRPSAVLSDAPESLGRLNGRVRLHYEAKREIRSVRGQSARRRGAPQARLPWGSLLLCVADRPGPTENRRRARAASAAVLKLYPAPSASGPSRQALN